MTSPPAPIHPRIAWRVFLLPNIDNLHFPDRLARQESLGWAHALAGIFLRVAGDRLNGTLQSRCPLECQLYCVHSLRPPAFQREFSLIAAPWENQMAKSISECPKCAGKLEAGYLPDAAYAGQQIGRWEPAQRRNPVGRLQRLQKRRFQCARFDVPNVAMSNCMPAMNSLRNKPNEMPLRFTIRDLLWLILAIALFLVPGRSFGIPLEPTFILRSRTTLVFSSASTCASRNRDLSDAIWRSLYLAVRDRI